MTRGLTLVELIITISLTALIGIPSGILLSRQLNAAIDARDYTVAMSLARAEMERIDSLNNFSSIAPQAWTPVSGFPSYERQVNVPCLTSANCNTGNFQVKRVDVTVRKTGSSSPLATLSTYRTQDVLFGS
ncbi:MAG: hypothetical protein Q8R78_07615 [Candidatus Omnitrophota bacterium]|nr:hypothetical protein [Candidatus Omnitrophota bacterium]